MKWVRNFFLVATAVLILGSVTVIVKAQTTAETAKENSTKTIEYALPYPGILPDNVLYPLKVFRDKVFEFLIRDPVKKGDFYLLQADKRLAAGEALINGNKPMLGEQTISKAEKYLNLAIENMKIAKKQQRELLNLPDRIKRASVKHDELITILLIKIPDEFKKGLDTSDVMAKALMVEVETLLNPKSENSSSPSAMPK